MGVDSMTTMTSDVGAVSGNMSGGTSAMASVGSEATGTNSASLSDSASQSPTPNQVEAAGNTANMGNADAVSGAENAEADKSNTEPTTPASFDAAAYNFAMPAAVAQDPALVSRIQDFCASSQLSPQQAQAAMGFWQAEQNAAMEQGLKHCEQNLKDRWQGAYDHKLEQARSTLKMLDNRMEGRLMPLMQGPLGNSPVFAEMLEKLSDVVG